ncbi:MAG: histidine phosphatase family protein [Flavobacteriales bacterium]|nr:histidine phosphatase family protein [Flavobacteriales bacterium]MBP6643658.1 histidine phosphatase family protein [Flavobacteriales bacterium]MBP7154969.1 histidine phosphatase family protein [Flavobacteriales bacterium]HQV74469.1 histidine phosphatase family protein [Flavobacteriales bacterium]HQW40015.1 histidine phosphatase family protein [Flavobacteriales bacterium]
MKTLYLCRHAKSSWSMAGMADFDRPLNERGLRNAPFMANLLMERGERVDAIVTSPANRALTTARAFATALDIPDARFKQDRAIYHAERSTLVHVVNNLPNDAQRVLLFGHNPGFSELLYHLADAGVRVMPTCGLARIDFALDDWGAVARNTGNLVWFDYPKNHSGQE